MTIVRKGDSVKNHSNTLFCRHRDSRGTAGVSKQFYLAAIVAYKTKDGFDCCCFSCAIASDKTGNIAIRNGKVYLVKGELIVVLDQIGYFQNIRHDSIPSGKRGEDNETKILRVYRAYRGVQEEIFLQFLHCQVLLVKVLQRDVDALLVVVLNSRLQQNFLFLVWFR